MEGQIVKIISNLYFVESNGETYKCNSRGNFRNRKITPVVGDFCIFDKETNYILDILPRKNYLDRPLVSNIDQGLIVTSLKTPDFSTNLFILIANELSSIMAFTKNLPDKIKYQPEQLIGQHYGILFKRKNDASDKQNRHWDISVSNLLLH